MGPRVLTAGEKSPVTRECHAGIRGSRELRRSGDPTAEQSRAGGSGGGAREADRPRGTRPAKRAPDPEPGRARSVTWITSPEWHGRTRMRGSARRFCITSTSIACGRRSGRLSPRPRRGWTALTWEDYGVDLEENLRDLHARVHRGAYRARPSRRVFIPKPDRAVTAARCRLLGGQGPAAGGGRGAERHLRDGLPGISYGFRPGRRSASCAGRARGRDQAEGELGARPGLPWIYVSRLDHQWLDAVPRAPDRGPEARRCG